MKQYIALILSLFLLSSSIRSEAKIKESRLFLNYGLRMMADSLYQPFFSFDKNTTQDTVAIQFPSIVKNQDSLELWLVNNSNTDLTIACLDTQFIAIGDSALFKIYSWTQNSFIPLRSTDSSLCYLGAQTIILQKNAEQEKVFVWCLDERSKSISEAIVQNQAYSFANYDPDYFLINQLYNPQTMRDSMGRVTGNVSDTIYILVVNFGHSGHSLHFHGYHVQDLNSLSGLHGKVWKDTLPIRKGASGLLLLVPDKPGEYPVHDHNLVAVSGGGHYPNGMFTSILIQ